MRFSKHMDFMESGLGRINSFRVIEYSQLDFSSISLNLYSEIFINNRNKYIFK